MSKFVHLNLSAQHVGANRIDNTIEFVKTRSFRWSSSRGLASLLVAAMVAALLVVANQVIDSITDGHLFAAWIGLWAVGFAAMALLAEPATQLIRKLRGPWAAWRAARHAAAEDEKLWDLALHDERVMSDIRAAMSRA